MPLDRSGFPEEVQVAFFISDQISDRWEGMSGSYMGKNWIEVEPLFKLYKIDNPKEILGFMQVYDMYLMKRRFEDAERRRKVKEAPAGKNYTHNVKG
tara:strand:+ start:157 stop:447 length:291 start_codon:yes stop_codon:yes gene_type:complete